ncbi:hypothetical protein GCM10023156_27320 [Novipirellula rosea]|uniref:Uncharacterized protein n=1 Tax=Novipirellula rosea TaxID=1031540 RepID=A0ABP8MT71_9BACT
MSPVAKQQHIGVERIAAGQHAITRPQIQTTFDSVGILSVTSKTLFVQQRFDVKSEQLLAFANAVELRAQRSRGSEKE